MRAFVTGGTGFVGSHLVETLLAGGHDVTCLVRTASKMDQLFPGRRPAVLAGSLADEEALARGTADAEVVFHVAAVTAARTRAEFFLVNEEATRRLVEVASRNPSLRRLVLVSSLAAAGPSERGRPRSPADRAAPVTHYGASKLAAELIVRAGKVPWTIVRPPTVFGPRDIEVLRLFRLTRRGVAPVFGDGSQELSLVYVEDLADALVAAVDAPEGFVYHAAHPEILTTRQVVDAIHSAVRPGEAAGPRVLRIPGMVARGALWVTGTAARLTGRATILSPDKANEFLAAAWTCTTIEFEEATGWRAQVSPAEGLRRTAAWYRARGWL